MTFVGASGQQPGGGAGFVPVYGSNTLPAALDVNGDPIPIPMTLIAGWSIVPVSVPGPTVGLLVGLGGLAIPAGLAGDYDLEYGLTLASDTAPLAVDVIQSVYGFDAGAGFVPIWPTMDWHDLIRDFADTPMLGLQGGTLWKAPAPARLAIALRSVGANIDVKVYTASMEAVRVSQP